MHRVSPDELGRGSEQATEERIFYENLEHDAAASAPNKNRSRMLGRLRTDALSRSASALELQLSFGGQPIFYRVFVHSSALLVKLIRTLADSLFSHGEGRWLRNWSCSRWLLGLLHTKPPSRFATQKRTGSKRGSRNRWRSKARRETN